MKKMFLGGLCFMGGLMGSTGLMIATSLNPWDYQGITGWIGSLLGMKMVLPFLVFSILSLVGLIICVKEAYF